jgi:phenylacetate-CoA ligase
MIARPHSDRQRREQDRLLRALVTHAYERVPMHHRRFEEAGVTPSQIRGVEDLPLLPILGRSEVQTTPVEAMVTRGLDPRRLARVRTGGSTGTPVTVYIGGRELDRRTWMSRYRSRVVSGCRPWAKRIDVQMPRPVLWWQRPARRFSDVRVDKRLPASEIVGRIRQYKPQLVSAWPTTWLQICDEVEATTGTERLADVYRSGGEDLEPYVQKRVERVLLQGLVRYYGSWEFGSIALECAPRSGFHIYSDNVVVETASADRSESSMPGAGEILITALRQKAMPLIRYRIGDYGVLSERRCRCGSPFPILEELQGRTNDAIETRSGLSVTGHEFYNGFRPLEYLDRCQFVQRTPGALEARIQPNDRFDAAAEDEVLQILRRLTHDDMDISLVQTDSFPPPKSGKFKLLVRQVAS